MKKLTLLITILLIFGCGYKIAGLINNSGLNYKYHIASIVNNADEANYRSMLDREATIFFTRYSALAKKKNADYRLHFRLDSVTTSASINSRTNQAVRSDLSARLHILVLDKNSNNVFDKTFSRTNSFTISNSISENRRNRNEAFRNTISDILLGFKNEFEK
ncbi:hypothetical protein Flexsi_1306 [Flexistipes sinusarabici DSM 4947]|uniref:Lipoprotein n=1 Tax=Flexistipes sinusarabici (strain ATCC 49648 / DSM 4947 / MAS 10) TaxID=717231 RepID=F8E7H0_FLESM|nr:hypothetical protein [Flexistipes sinusarabici]AEI14957.1 hypothetical protein Flexsi_1306 [Flexistipes sinusarabici DSM 4947]